MFKFFQFIVKYRAMLAKVAKGEKFTEEEQKLWDSWTKQSKGSITSVDGMDSIRK